MNKKLRVLAIGAHPDDCELGMGGTAIKYKNLDHVVKFVSATRGDLGHYEMGGAKLAIIRRRETKKACNLFGIESEVFDIQDNNLETDIATREKFIRLIRKFKPDIIFTHRLNDYHPDHRRTSILVQDSSYAIRIPSVCPLVPYLTYTPVIMYMADNFKKPNPFEPKVMVDIDDVINNKTDMMYQHKSQVYEWLPWMDGKLDQVPSSEKERFEWLKKQIVVDNKVFASIYRDKLKEQYGQEYGSKIECAEGFELCEYGANLSEKEISKYFPFI